MKTDSSRAHLENFLRSRNKRVTVYLRNKSVMKGIMIGFFKSSRATQPYVFRWHLVDYKDNMTLGTDFLGNRIGTFINQKEILDMEFDSDTTLPKEL